MFRKVKTAMKIKELRHQIGFTLIMILLLRLGSQIPVPGIETEYFKQWFSSQTSGTFNILSAFTGGSFERFSLFALGITPYITMSIILQLMTIVIPGLEELQKDGEYGRKKMERITQIGGVILAFVESVAMAIGFGRTGLLPNMNLLRGASVVICLTIGTVLLILMGELIKKKGIGNGISIILMVSILSGIPSSIASVFEHFASGKSLAKMLLAAGGICFAIVAIIMYIVILNEAVHKVPIQYSAKNTGKKLLGGQSSILPIKVNLASVAPVIFASSLFSVPQMLAAITGKGYGSGLSAVILNMTNQNNWFKNPVHTVGFLLFALMIVFFSYFYANIIFNPKEVADNLRKHGGVIPGYRPGKQTEDYLSDILKRILFIGSAGLLIVVTVPILFSNLLGVGVSFGGTSMIIVVGVILETMNQIETKMQASNYAGFLK